MKADRIRINEFVFESILDCKGRKAFGEHGYLIITGIIKKEREVEYLEKAKILDRVQVVMSSMNEEAVLFNGVLYEFFINHDDGVPILTVHLKTGSYLADIKKHVRSFQKIGEKYETLAQICLKEYEGAKCIIGKIYPIQTKSFLMQFNETDWEFLNRLASLSNSLVLADDETGNVKLYFGIPQFKRIRNINSGDYTVYANLENRYKGEKDIVFYEVEEREVYKVGEKVRFNDKILIIYAINTMWKGNELVHTYLLTTEEGIAAGKTVNKILSGNSILANVTGVERDKVTIEIEMDENSDNENKKWFPYATIYSTPDGTGWYCMPEIGDKVRVYFPTDDENDAYVESSVHLENKENRVKPEEKSIMNHQKKEILFTPDSLILRNNKGLSIELLDEQGIKIVSDKSVFINSKDTIYIKSNTDEIKMSAGKGIEMKQGSSCLKIAEKITMTGGKINLN